jgi:hypothetical protein
MYRTLKFLALQTAPYIYDISRLRVKFGVVPEDGGRRPKHIGKDFVLLYENIYDQIFGITIK